MATRLRPDLSLPEGEQDLSTPGITDYTGPQPATTFRDKSGREVTLTDTDMAPYLANPELAQMEADVTQARYGGSPIQDFKTADQAKAAPFQRPSDMAGLQEFPRRSVFEKSIFNTLKSETNSTGNPFDIDIPTTVERISKGDLPDLFNQAFKGRVTWEDRSLLNKEEKEFWLAEAKKYRAYLKERVVSQKATTVAQYNQIMARFDNDKKEHEAALRKVESKTRAFAKEQRATRKEAAANRKDEAGLKKRKVEILKDISGLTQEIFDAETQASGAALPEEQVTAYRDQVVALREELQGINQRFGQGRMDLTKHGEIDTAGHEKKRLAGKKGAGGTGLRADGTKKGKGFLGELKRTDNADDVSTEISIGVKIDGKETEIPALVPTLTKKEVDHLLAGGEVTDVIATKATVHAKKRIKAGLSPFKEDGEDVPKKFEKVRKIKRTGTHKGRRVIQYESGDLEYDD